MAKVEPVQSDQSFTRQFLHRRVVIHQAGSSRRANEFDSCIAARENRQCITWNVIDQISQDIPRASPISCGQRALNDQLCLCIRAEMLHQISVEQFEVRDYENPYSPRLLQDTS